MSENNSSTPSGTAQSQASSIDTITDPNSDKYWRSHFSYLGRCTLNLIFFPAALVTFVLPTSKYENHLWNTKLNLSRNNTSPARWLTGLGTVQVGGYQLKPSYEFQFMLDRLRSFPQPMTKDVRNYYHYWILRKTNKELFRNNPIQYIIRDNTFDVSNYILNAYFLAVPTYFLQRYDIIDLEAAKKLIERDNKTSIRDVIKPKNLRNLLGNCKRRLYWLGCVLFGFYSVTQYRRHDDAMCHGVRKKLYSTKNSKDKMTTSSN